MPRPLRPQVAGWIYHLVSRGVRNLPIYTDDESRRRFLGLLDETIGRYEWELHAWCLMTNHFHLLVTTVEPTVSEGMQYLNAATHSGSTGGTVTKATSSNGDSGRH